MQEHKSVLLHETVEILGPKPGGVYIDATAGSGGHSRAICERIGEKGRLIVIDEDEDALLRAQEALAGCKAVITFVKDNFRNMKHIAEKHGVMKVDGIVFDLGLSTPQLANSGRGFSFGSDEPLLMTFAKDANGKVTADIVVNEWSETSLGTILRGFADERFAQRIAKAIAQARERKHIETTGELVEIISRAVPIWYRHRKTHFATKTFQALRIAVNDETNALSEGLAGGFSLLVPGGRMAVISFHSLEDRIVKNFFKEKAASGEAAILTKKPIVPTRKEIIENSRSRSSKLRALTKVL